MRVILFDDTKKVLIGLFIIKYRIFSLTFEMVFEIGCADNFTSLLKVHILAKKTD